MSCKLDGKGVAFALFFLVVLLTLFDVLSQESVIADFFNGPEIQQGRVERAVQRATNR
jgi:hypothetical protein